MKKSALLLIAICFVSFSYCQTLFTYGNNKVTAAEFLQAYNKNKTAGSDSTQSLRDYLDLYIKFKLKVQAAKDLRLDTLPSLKADLQNFRGQVQNNYLKDDAATDKLIDEAFNRSQKDIHTIYFFLPFASEADSSNATDKAAINTLYAELKKNRNDNDILAKLNKGTLQVQRNGAGYITAFTLPYEFENIVYALKPGEISAPHRTKKGWFIFKNAGERPAVGKITVAQILFAIPEGYSQQKEQVKKTADSVYDALQKGADFAELAKQFSDDRSTFYNGGQLPEFGTAKYDAVFEDHAFALKKDGEIAAPFETAFGYHILKRISASPVPALKNDETFMYELKQEVLNDSRINIAKQKFISSIIPLIGYKKSPVNETDLWNVTDSSLLKNRNVKINGVNENTILFTYNNKAVVRVRDWILYVSNLNKTIPEDSHTFYKDIFPEFINASDVSNYASRMENFNPEFKKQMNEFKEGNMLFEIMQRKVWGKASADSAGLVRFYNEHKNKYFWNASADAIIFSCSDKTTYEACVEELKNKKTWKEILSEYPAKVQADSGRYELGQIPVFERTNFTNGLITAPVVNKNDGTVVFSKIIKVYPDHQQRNFEDARGLVINDYQNNLEEKWIAQLRKKYPVKIDEKVFQQIAK